MGPSVLAIIDSISKKKGGLIFFLAKLDTKGGGGPGASCLWTQKLPILIFEYFPYVDNVMLETLTFYTRNELC